MMHQQFAFSFLLLVLLSSNVFSQGDVQPIYSSSQTQIIVKPGLPRHLTEAEVNRAIEVLNISLHEIEVNFDKKMYPGGRGKTSAWEDWTGAVAIGAAGDIPGFGGGMNGFLGKLDEERTKEIQPFLQDRLFKQNSALGKFFSEIRQRCNNDPSCIEQAAKSVSEDPKVRQVLLDNPGLIEQARLKELVASSAANASTMHEEILNENDNQNALIAATANELSNQITQIAANQATLINNTATIIQTQQEHTIALANLQATINQNQEELRQRLAQGFGEVTKLQKENIFLTQLVLAHTKELELKLDTVMIKLDNIGEDVNTIRERQLSQIFNSSSLIDKLRMLEGEEGKEMISNEEERRTTIENVRVLIREEQIIMVTRKVREWGIVSLEALNVIYPNCPPEIKKLVSVSITASDIVGSITSGNWSQAILSGLSLFKSPTPGPEMQMLTRITEQLTNMETNMNAQFKEVHAHLFAMEDNLVARLEIVDQKLDMISEQVQFTYTELSEQLLSVDNKLSYVIKQNDCTEDLILEIFKSNNSDVCEIPVREFKKRVAEGLINSMEDLENFFIGQQCKNCIEALFKNSSQDLVNSQLFRYTDCNTATATDNNRPDYVYDFMFNRLLPDSLKTDPYWRFAILLLPKNVSLAAVIMDSIRAMPDTLREKIRTAYAQFNLTETDRQYRHYMAVLEFADYVLTMMPFLELYNDGGLMKYEQIVASPEITKERSKKIIGFLDNLSDLIDHTIFQQSVMTGMATFKSVDKLIESGEQEDGSGMTLGKLFAYNPVFNKNYSSYFIEKRYGGFKSLERVVKGSTFRFAGRYYQGNNTYESLISKDQHGNMSMSTNWSGSLNKKPIFQCYMPDLRGVEADTAVYNNNLLGAIPRSLPALLKAKRQINLLSAEMRFLVSDELDRPNAPVARRELDTIFQIQKTH